MRASVLNAILFLCACRALGQYLRLRGGPQPQPQPQPVGKCPDQPSIAEGFASEQYDYEAAKSDIKKISIALDTSGPNILPGRVTRYLFVNVTSSENLQALYSWL